MCVYDVSYVSDPCHPAEHMQQSPLEAKFLTSVREKNSQKILASTDLSTIIATCDCWELCSFALLNLPYILWHCSRIKLATRDCPL